MMNRKDNALPSNKKSLACRAFWHGFHEQEICLLGTEREVVPRRALGSETTTKENNRVIHQSEYAFALRLLTVVRSYGNDGEFQWKRPRQPKKKRYSKISGGIEPWG